MQSPKSPLVGLTPTQKTYLKTDTAK
jgi:hypothetical protein